MEEKQPLLLHKISKIISDFFNPLVSLFIFFIYMSVREYSLKESILYFVPILLMIIVPVVIWLVWNVKTGRYTNMDVSDRVQRKNAVYIYCGMCGYLSYFQLFQKRICRSGYAFYPDLDFHHADQ